MNREAIEEKIAQGKRNRKEAGNKYGMSYIVVLLSCSSDDIDRVLSYCCTTLYYYYNHDCIIEGRWYPSSLPYHGYPGPRR